jgi:arginyl-tRNA synthetase
METKDKIIDALKEVTGVAEPHLELTQNLEHGDYASNIALQQAKQEGKNPRDLAEEYIKKISEDSILTQIVSKIEVAGPGFINFYLSDETLTRVAEEIQEKQSDYGKTDANRDKKVIVEYSSPNIAKPFTVGHLRSTIIGDAVANILEFTGWKVYRDNHVGDWGTQFGKQIYAIKTWGNEEAIEKSENPVKELVALYIKFHEEAEKDSTIEEKGREWFKKLEDGDPEAKRLWQKCIEWSFVEFNNIYKQLGVQFTENDGVGYGESYFDDKMEPVLQELKDKDLLQEGKEGAQLVFFPDDRYPPLMILKKDGTTLYATRDLATDKFRLEKYGQDITIINEVGIEQSLYFQQLYELEEMLGWLDKKQRVHIKHGHYRFADKKMSTRKGNVIWLENVLEEAHKRAFMIIHGKHDVNFEKDYIETVRKVNPDKTLKFSEISNLSEVVSIGALKWNDLKRDSKIDIIFDWDELLNMQGNSGPYLQYTFARTQSVLEKAENSSTDFHVESFEVEEQKLVRFLARFPEVIVNASNLYSPSVVANYLFELAQMYNGFYSNNRIIGSKTEAERLVVTRSVGVIIKNGLKLLGIEAPVKM